MSQPIHSVRQESPAMAGLVRPVLISAVLFMVITGLLYPLVTTGISELLFPHQAQGSIITEHGTDVGSALIRAMVHPAQILSSAPKRYHWYGSQRFKQDGRPTLQRGEYV